MQKAKRLPCPNCVTNQQLITLVAVTHAKPSPLCYNIPTNAKKVHPTGEKSMAQLFFTVGTIRYVSNNWLARKAHLIRTVDAYESQVGPPGRMKARARANVWTCYAYFDTYDACVTFFSRLPFRHVHCNIVLPLMHSHGLPTPVLQPTPDAPLPIPLPPKPRRKRKPKRRKKKKPLAKSQRYLTFMGAGKNK